MKKNILVLVVLFSIFQAQAQTLEDSLANFGKTYVVVSTTEKLPDTLNLHGKKYLVVPGTGLETEKPVKGNLVIVSNADTASSQALNLKGKIYVAESEVNMADLFRANGKIFVVVAVLSIILAGFFIYLISLDKKIHKLKNQQ